MERQLTQTTWLMGLDMRKRPCNTGLCLKTMRHNTPTTVVEAIKGRGRMGFKQLETSTLPIVRLTASEPRLTVRENGQGVISTAAAEALQGCGYVVVLRDEEKNLLALKPSKEKPKEGLKLNKPKKGKSVMLGLGGVLRKYFPAYEFAKAGTQQFAVRVANTKTGPMLVIEIPRETPEYRAPAKRKPRKVAPTSENEVTAGGDHSISLE